MPRIRTFQRCLSVRVASVVMGWAFDFFFLGSSVLGRIERRVMNSMKVMMKETIRPEIIIQPKASTGTMPLNKRDANPVMVVRTAKALGVNFSATVFSTSQACGFWGLFSWSSRKWTIKWIASDIVRIICREIKFDETTVTLRPRRLSRPIMARTDAAQQEIASAIQRSFLKMIHKMIIMQRKTPVPKVLRSVLMKPIMSSAMTSRPPRYIIPWGL